ncbi:MAG TPA: HlyD family efflux transporter periplasmic adaptor subunit [Candidatus Sulfotelmatobacter sp.]|nr:HlyD family efflux transporter periplasmic adaptor subunit [Candidatus Sulfotelmatobacter sp.]
MTTSPVEITPSAETSSGSPQMHSTPPEKTRERSLMKRRLSVIAAAAVIVAAFVLVALRGSRHSVITIQISASAATGNALRLKGTTEAVQSRSILAPLLSGQQVHTLTIIHLLPAGARVKQGDLLVEFDRQDQLRDFIDKKAEYEKLMDQVAEEQAKEVAARAKDDTELKTAEDNLRKSELEVQKDEIVSRIDAEKNQENLDEAKATYDQLRETYNLKRNAAEAAIRILEIQRDRTQQTMLHAQANADLMQIHSPLDGVVVLNTIWKQGTMGEVQEGDQVRAGVPFMQVVNPATMQVRVMANQQDFPVLQVGQTAKVRLDAYPEMVFSGKVDQVSPIGEGSDFSSKIRNFAIVVAIQGNDPRLMPDLSAAVDVDTSTKKAETAGPTASGSGS